MTIVCHGEIEGDRSFSLRITDRFFSAIEDCVLVQVVLDQGQPLLEGMAQIFLKLVIVWKLDARFLYLHPIQLPQLSKDGNLSSPCGSVNRHHGGVIIRWICCCCCSFHLFSQRKELFPGQQQSQRGSNHTAVLARHTDHNELGFRVTELYLCVASRSLPRDAKAPCHGPTQACRKFFF